MARSSELEREREREIGAVPTIGVYPCPLTASQRRKQEVRERKDLALENWSK
jgi:hypothetical protein